MKKPKYIKDAIVWNGRIGKRGAWVRAGDMNLIVTSEREYWSPAFSWPHWILTEVYPYQDWMEEYIGTEKNLKKDERVENYDG